MDTDIGWPKEKLEGRRKVMFIRRCLGFKQHFFHKDGGMFLTQKECIEDSTIRNMPGKQNKHHGRKPGSYKYKRDIVKASRRKNRT